VRVGMNLRTLLHGELGETSISHQVPHVTVTTSFDPYSECGIWSCWRGCSRLLRAWGRFEQLHICSDEACFKLQIVALITRTAYRRPRDSASKKERCMQRNLFLQPRPDSPASVTALTTKRQHEHSQNDSFKANYQISSSTV
jgi:hypothetical protein